MSYSITENARAIINDKILTPSLVVSIEGYGDLLTSATIEEVARYGAPGLYYGKAGLVYGGTTGIENQQDLISLSGSTTKITQQLLQDEGASTSTTNVTIALVNKDNVFASLVTPEDRNDLISKKATIYLGAEGFRFPEDFLRIFVGNVTSITMNGGLIKIQISHPENEKRFDLFTKIQSNLTSGISNSATTIPVESTEGYLLSADLMTAYVRVDDEIIRVGGKTDTSYTGCTRGQLGTTAVAHDDDTNVDSFYILGDATFQSNAIDLALKVLISTCGEYTTGVASTFGISPEPLTVNSLYFVGRRLFTYENVQIGDTLSVTGATESGNNVTGAVVLQITEDGIGTRVVIDQPLTPEVDSTAVAGFYSQYDTLPDGVGLSPDQVDIAEFRKVYDLFSSSLIFSKIYLKESISGKDLLNKEILFPSACYSIPRKGAVSVGKTKPPIAEYENKVIDDDTVLNAQALTISRSSLENFYNAVVYRYEEHPLLDKFLAGRVTLSASSTDRIKVGNKPYLIQAKGIRKTPDNETIITNNSQRLLDRYQFGAEQIKGVQVSFSTGWNIEIGDTLIVQGMQLLDSKTGLRSLKPRIMEVSNRSFEFRRGIIELDLTDTAFALDGRYGTVSPSSVVGVGSDPENVFITRSYGTTSLQLERDKWAFYIGQLVQIHNPNWTTVGSAELLGFSPTNDNVMLLGPGLGFTPAEGDIIDIEPYDTAGDIYKASHVYMDPRRTITAAASQTSVTVNDPTVFFVGSIIMVHSPTFGNVSKEVVVESIAGSVLTLEKDLGYVPSAGDFVDLVGFVSDNGLPYRIL